MSHFRKYAHFLSNFDQKFAKFDLNLTGRSSADLQLRCDPNAEGKDLDGKFWFSKYAFGVFNT